MFKKSVASITRSLTTMVKDLRTHETQQDAEHTRLLNAAAVAQQERDAAASIATKIEALLT